MRMHAVERVTDANPEDNPRDNSLIEDLIAHGYARIRLGRETCRQIERTIATARDFYAQPLAEKRRFAAPAFVEGYRDIGLEYSLQPDRPDLTESFSLWNRNRHHAEMVAWSKTCALYTELRTSIDMLVPLVADVFDALTERWAPGAKAPRFEKASYIQLNYYEPASHRREMLQDEHEDGHLITIITATAPGLEMKTAKGYVPVELAEDEMLVMPGSLLTLMTGGKIPPLFHRVRNSFHAAPRCSLMAFINPEIDQKLDPWVRNASNAGIDIVEQANALPKKFGLPTLVDGGSGRGR